MKASMKAILLAVAVLVGFAQGQDDPVFTQKLNHLARKVSMDGSHVGPMGVIGVMRLQKPVAKETPGNRFKTSFVWVDAGMSDGVLSGAKDVQAGEMIDQTGRPYGLRDFKTISITWSGKAWPIGKIQYLTGQGLLRTCPLWTASEDDARTFYRAHGFTPEAAAFVKKCN